MTIRRYLALRRQWGGDRGGGDPSPAGRGPGTPLRKPEDFAAFYAEMTGQALPG